MEIQQDVKDVLIPKRNKLNQLQAMLNSVQSEISSLMQGYLLGQGIDPKKYELDLVKLSLCERKDESA